jgi:hypothetical protein
MTVFFCAAVVFTVSTKLTREAERSSNQPEMLSEE